jgi:hypothetical protein
VIRRSDALSGADDRLQPLPNDLRPIRAALLLASARFAVRFFLRFRVHCTYPELWLRCFSHSAATALQSWYTHTKAC